MAAFKLYVCLCSVVVLFCYGRPTENELLPHSRDFYAGYIKALNDNFEALFKPERQTRSISSAEEKESAEENRTKVLDELVDKNPQKREDSEDIDVHKRDLFIDDIMTTNTADEPATPANKDTLATVVNKVESGEKKSEIKMVDDTSMLNDTESEGEVTQENDEGDHSSEEEGSGEKKTIIDKEDEKDDEDEGTSGDKRSSSDVTSGDSRSIDDVISGDKRSNDDETSGDKRSIDVVISGDKRSFDDIMSGDKRSVHPKSKDTATDETLSGDNDAGETNDASDANDASESTSDIMASGSGTASNEADTAKLTPSPTSNVKGEGNFEEENRGEKRETRSNAEEEISGNKESAPVESNEQVTSAEEEDEEGSSESSAQHELPPEILKKAEPDSSPAPENSSPEPKSGTSGAIKIVANLSNGTVMEVAQEGGGLVDRPPLNNSIVEKRNGTEDKSPVDEQKEEEGKEEENEEDETASGIAASGDEKLITSGDDINIKIAKATEKIADGEDENAVIANDVVVTEKKSDIADEKKKPITQFADDTNVKRESQKKTIINIAPDEESNERNKKTVYKQESDDDDDVINDPPPHVIVSSKKTNVPKNVTVQPLRNTTTTTTATRTPTAHRLHKKHHRSKHRHRYTPEVDENVKSDRRGGGDGGQQPGGEQQLVLPDTFTNLDDDDKALINAPEPSNYANQIPGIETSTIGRFSDENQEAQVVQDQDLPDPLSDRGPVMFYTRAPDIQTRGQVDDHPDYENLRRHFILEHASMQHLPYMPGIMSGFAEDQPQEERGMMAPAPERTFMAPDNNNNMLSRGPAMMSSMNGYPGNNMALPSNANMHDNQLMNEQYDNGMLAGNGMMPSNGMLTSNGMLPSNGMYPSNGVLPSNPEVASYRPQNAYINQFQQQQPPPQYATMEQNQYVDRYSNHGVEGTGNQFLPDASSHVPGNTRSRVMNALNRHNNHLFRMQSAAVDRFMHNAAQLYKFGNEFARHSPALMEQTGVVRSLVSKRRNPQDHVLLQPIVVLMPVGRWD